MFLRNGRLEDGPQIPQDHRVVHISKGLLPESTFWNCPGSLVLGLGLDFGGPFRHGLLPPGPGALLLVNNTVFVGATADAQVAGAI